MTDINIKIKTTYSSEINTVTVKSDCKVVDIMKEIEKLNALPAEEAKRVALTNLFDAGIIDEDGNYTAPYVALGK